MPFFLQLQHYDDFVFVRWHIPFPHSCKAQIVRLLSPESSAMVANEFDSFEATPFLKTAPTALRPRARAPDLLQV